VINDRIDLIEYYDCHTVQIPNYYPSQIQPQSHQIPLGMSSSAPLVEGGMFSDVDYDIDSSLTGAHACCLIG
jgi:hypothetical protein